MKIDRFILRDSIDPEFADLVVLEEEVDTKEIQRIIDRVKEERPYEYDFDFLYGVLGQEIKFKKVYDLYSTITFEY